MPTPALRALAKRAAVPLATVERLWAEAKAAAAERFKPGTPRYWAYAMAITRNRLGLRRVGEAITFKQFLQHREPPSAK
jgi:hypothetical protein